MPLFDPDGLAIHWQQSGPDNGPPLILAHALGLDLSIWDSIIPLLPSGLRIIRYDLRGHGQSACPPAPYRMGQLVSDAERLLDALTVRDAVFVGLSVGGLIAQGLAVKRLDQVRALVLADTAARIGTADAWGKRIEAVRVGGIAAIADDVLARWFPPARRAGPEALAMRALLLRCPTDGYMGVSAAIAGTDFYATTASLTLPALGLAGVDDGSTPPDLVRETAALMKGSDFRLIRRAGHLPPVDAPEAFAAEVTAFLRRIGHG